MVKRNPNFSKLQASYLFRLIGEKKEEFLKENPNAKLILLSCGTFWIFFGLFFPKNGVAHTVFFSLPGAF